MWRERVLFLVVGIAIGALGFTLGRGRPTPDASGGADGSREVIAELRTRIAALEAETKRPPELAVPNRAPSRVAAPAVTSPVAATPPEESASPGMAAPLETETALESLPWKPMTLTRKIDYSQLVELALETALRDRAGAPVWDATTTDDKLRYGTDEEKAKAFDVLGSATSKDYLPVAQHALEASTDDNRTRALIGTIARLKDRPWSAWQATGAPDTPIGGDLGTAWASAAGDMGEVTLDLTYGKAVRVDRVRVHETHAPGAIAKILAKAADGSWDMLWEGRTSAAESPNWFAPTLQATRYTTATIRLVLDTDRVADWNEIDAVELEGDGFRQWATGATASSSYADR